MKGTEGGKKEKKREGQASKAAPLRKCWWFWGEGENGKEAVGHCAMAHDSLISYVNSHPPVG